MSKNELLARAKNLGITGRHDMTKDELEVAVAQREAISKAKPKRNLVKNTNVPWRRKFYYVDIDNYEMTSEQRSKAPAQVQLLLKYMVDNQMTSSEAAEQGVTIASSAINSGYVKSKIDAPVLFAYYRVEMEALGLVFAGYNFDK